MNDTTDTEDTNADWDAALAEQTDSDGAGSAEADWDAALADQAAGESESYEQAALEDLHDEGGAGAADEDVNLDVILDIPVNMSMQVGSTKISIRNLLKLNQGSVVELDRLAGEPLDVTVNGTLIAHGEVVVVNEKYGIRLTDVISAAERIKKLK
jgi:flagellar motor switch protein FliN/FliY